MAEFYFKKMTSVSLPGKNSQEKSSQTNQPNTLKALI
jgi:hypothetical protein